MRKVGPKPNQKGSIVMMKHEFEELLTKALKSKVPVTVCSEIWEDVEMVYQWHPAIHDVGGKQEIVGYYLSGVVFDMVVTAKKVEQCEARIRTAKAKLKETEGQHKQEIERLKDKVYEEIVALSQITLMYTRKEGAK